MDKEERLEKLIPFAESSFNSIAEILCIRRTIKSLQEQNENLEKEIESLENDIKALAEETSGYDDPEELSDYPIAKRRAEQAERRWLSGFRWNRDRIAEKKKRIDENEKKIRELLKSEPKLTEESLKLTDEFIQEYKKYKSFVQNQARDAALDESKVSSDDPKTSGSGACGLGE